MKTIFTLFFATAMLSTAFAQYGQNDRNHGNDKNVYANNGNYGHDSRDKDFRGGYSFSPRERDMQLNQINQRYAYKIQDVKTKPFMSWFHKKRLINNLEAQRDADIRDVYQKFNSPKNQFGDFGRNDKKRW